MAVRKDDKGKPKLGLLPYDPLCEIARVLEYGADKYEKNQWRGGTDWTRYYDAAMRHMHLWNDPSYEDHDHETGLSHLAHAACCLLFLLYYEANGVGKDDRDA